MALVGEKDCAASDDVQAPVTEEVPPAPVTEEVPPAPVTEEVPEEEQVQGSVEHIAEDLSVQSEVPFDPPNEILVDAGRTKRGRKGKPSRFPPATVCSEDPPAAVGSVDPIGAVSFEPSSAIVPHDDPIPLNVILPPGRSRSGSISKRGRKRKASHLVRTPYERKKKK